MSGGDPTWKARARILLRWARLLFTPLSLLVIAWVLWQSRASLGAVFQQGEWQLLLAAVLLWILTHLLSPLISKHMLALCGISLTYSRAARIHCGRLPAKYLPGGIWHSVGRANDYLALGHDGKRVASYFLLENLLIVAVTLGVGGLVADGLVQIPGLAPLIRVLPLLVLGFLLALPLFARRFAGSVLVFSVASYVLVILLLACYWALVGIAFAVFISAFPALGIVTPLAEIAGSYIFSWSLGYLAVFAPQGIGVSEFVMSNLLTGGVTAGQLLVVLLGFRVLVLAGDLACWAASVLLASFADKQARN
jgi:glycosyltransferase 2 family protein